MTDTRQQRINMVESQVRPSDVTDRRIIRAMLEVPREAFVPARAALLAYMDEAVAVSASRTARAARASCWRRARFAKLVQLAEIEPSSRRCWMWAAPPATRRQCWRRLAKRGRGGRGRRGTGRRASPGPAQAGRGNAMVVHGPLGAGAPAQAPFDAILLNGAVPEVPPALLEQLKDGGRLVAVVARGRVGRAQVWRRTGKAFDTRPAFDAAPRPLPGFRAPGRIRLLDVAAESIRGTSAHLSLWSVRQRARAKASRFRDCCGKRIALHVCEYPSEKTDVIS